MQQKAIVFIFLLFVLASSLKTIFKFDQAVSQISGPIYVGNDLIVVSYSYSETDIHFQLINITTSQIIKNFTGLSSGENFDNLIWINGTETIVGTYLKSFSNNSQYEILSVWNLSQANPINQYTIPGNCLGFGQGYVFISQLPDSADYVAIAGRCHHAEISVINIWTNEIVYSDHPSNQNFFEGFAINSNLYSYIQENLINEEADIQSCLRVLNPKTKQILTNIVYNVSSVTYQPMFNSISPFKSKAFGNYLLGTISNGTCFILNTLNGEITTSFTLNYLDNYDPYCQTIFDETNQLFLCYSSNNQTQLTIYSKSTIIDSLQVSDSNGIYASIPEISSILFSTSTEIKQWTYKTQECQQTK